MIVAGYFWAWLVVFTLTGRPVGYEHGPRFDTYEDCEIARSLVQKMQRPPADPLEVCRPVPNPLTWAPLTTEIPDWRTWGKLYPVDRNR